MKCNQNFVPAARFKNYGETSTVISFRYTFIDRTGALIFF